MKQRKIYTKEEIEESLYLMLEDENGQGYRGFNYVRTLLETDNNIVYIQALPYFEKQDSKKISYRFETVVQGKESFYSETVPYNDIKNELKPLGKKYVNSTILYYNEKYNIALVQSNQDKDITVNELSLVQLPKEKLYGLKASNIADLDFVTPDELMYYVVQDTNMFNDYHVMNCLIETCTIAQENLDIINSYKYQDVDEYISIVEQKLEHLKSLNTISIMTVYKNDIEQMLKDESVLDIVDMLNSSKSYKHIRYDNETGELLNVDDEDMANLLKVSYETSLLFLKDAKTLVKDEFTIKTKEQVYNMVLDGATVALYQYQTKYGIIDSNSNEVSLKQIDIELQEKLDNKYNGKEKTIS